MREVVYLFSDKKKKYFFTSLIKLRIGQKYSHVAMLVEGRVYQASLGGVNKVTLNDFLKENKIIKSALTSLSDKAYRYMDKQLGKKYSVLGALASTFWILRKLGLGNNKDKSFICSEYAFRTHEEDHGHAVNSDYVDPRDLEKLLSNEGIKIKDGLNRL